MNVNRFGLNQAASRMKQHRECWKHAPRAAGAHPQAGRSLVHYPTIRVTPASGCTTCKKLTVKRVRDFRTQHNT